MRLSLTQHPDSRSTALRGIDVALARAPDGFIVRYRLLGSTADVSFPPPRRPQRADDLWRTTCFEAFLANDDGSYHELNFSPSTQWAVYRFDGYRAGMHPSDDVGEPRIEISTDAGVYELAASFDALPDVTRLGLSAVVEERDGAKSYWALAHPEGKPDFHHAASFALELSEHP